MKLIAFALATLVAASAMPASAQMMHRDHHGMMRACHMEYRHHHRVQICRYR